MAKDKITEYDATANNNTVCGDVNIAENSALPSDMNNFAREIMSHLKEGLGSGTPLYVDQTNNRVGINTTGSVRDLQIGDNSRSASILSLQTNSSGNGSIYFGDNTTTNAEYGGMIRYSHSDNAMLFWTSSTERMRIDSNGNVGIGTTSISSSDRLSINGGHARIVNSVAQSGNTLDNSTFSGLIVNNSNDANGDLAGIVMYPTSQYTAAAGVFGVRESQTAAGISFWSGSNTGSERMRIDSSGNLRVATTLTPAQLVDGTSGEGLGYQAGDFLGICRDGGGVMHLNRLSTDGEMISFRKNATNVGNISVTGSATSYNTSSDHRLKENVTADWDATTRLKQLNPVRFNFIADADTTVDGFLAHEVQSVVPEAISGTHNEVDDDGNPKYQGIDQSKLVPLLVKTIQELEARIVALETA